EAEAVHPRQHPVHDQCTVFAGAGPCEPFDAVMHLLDAVTLIFQRMHDMAGGLTIVLDQQYFHPAAPLLGNCLLLCDSGVTNHKPWPDWTECRGQVDFSYSRRHRIVKQAWD